jgi:hypothetical protein
VQFSLPSSLREAEMKTLNRQKLEVVNQTRSNPPMRDWRGQFTPEFTA